MKEQNTAEKKTSNDIAGLLIPAQMGSKEAQWKIVQSFEPLVKKLLQREKNPFRQEDLRQDLYLGILEAIQRFDNEPMFFPNYLKQSLHNIMGKYARHQIQERILEENLLAANIPMSAEPEYPGLEAEDTYHESRKILRAMEQLHPRARKLLQYRMSPVSPSWREIGKEMKISHIQAFRQYKRTVKQLKEKLRET